VVARGNERQAVVRDDRDRLHFVELLAESVERFGLRLYAWVLLDNHYHLLLESPEANLSWAMQWLGVSYTVWFNRRHGRSGHLFQGRFKAAILEPVTAGQEVSRYVHLNPVRVRRLGLSKSAQARARHGMCERPDPEQVARRLDRLRRYQWSSYRAYVGRTAAPPWLSVDRVLNMMGGRGRSAQQAAYQRYVETAVREGLAESPWERLEAGLVLGGTRFVEQVRQRLHGNPREQPQLRRLQARPSWEQVVAAVEQVKGERWEAFRDRYGDRGRDVALYLGRRRAQMRLRELAQAVGDVDYGSVAAALQRITRRLRTDRTLRDVVTAAERQLSNN
jgi:REP element-mobilizing transposase RayT